MPSDCRYKRVPPPWLQYLVLEAGDGEVEKVKQAVDVQH